MTEPLIRDIADTARWMAVFRAQETERRDAVFTDPFARALAGDRGEQIAKAVSFTNEYSWSFVARTYLFDRLVTHCVNNGADLVLNLAAGLDARPYRLELPASLRWVEADFADILDYKESILGDAKPRCAVERVRIDLSNHDARRGLFARLGREARNVFVMAEGLIVYLMRDEVAALGQDLAAQPSFFSWAVDLVSPGLLEMMKEQMGAVMQEAGAPFLFAPPEGPPFFETVGWKPVDVQSVLKAAKKLERLPMMLRMMASFPESAGAQGARPWSAVVLLQNRVTE